MSCSPLPMPFQDRRHFAPLPACIALVQQACKTLNVAGFVWGSSPVLANQVKDLREREVALERRPWILPVPNDFLQNITRDSPHPAYTVTGKLALHFRMQDSDVKCEESILKLSTTRAAEDSLRDGSVLSDNPRRRIFHNFCREIKRKTSQLLL
eukprot:3318806-Rhodomonas_salina.3